MNGKTSVKTNPKPAKGLDQHPMIKLKLRNLDQLFNSMDPSPFNEKDLDQDAEDFIVSWAQEFPTKAPLTLRIYLDEHSPDEDPKPAIEEGIHHFFSYQAELNEREFSQLMKQGRLSLMIGILFLGTCLILADLLAKLGEGTFLNIFRESLTIGGWVAMWRPIEIYLYRWWPVRRMGRIYKKLSRIKVEIRHAHKASTPAEPEKVEPNGQKTAEAAVK